MAKRGISIVMALVLSLGSAGASMAAEIIGRVTDPHGDAVQGIKIIVLKPIDKELVSSVTGADGSFDLKDLKEDTYFLKLDPQKTNFIGETVMATVTDPGVTIRWSVSTTAPAIALEEKGLRTDVAFWDKDPFGMTMKQLAVTGAISLLMIGGGVGGAAAAGAFNNNRNNQPSQRPPGSPHH